MKPFEELREECFVYFSGGVVDDTVTREEVVDAINTAIVEFGIRTKQPATRIYLGRKQYEALGDCSFCKEPKIYEVKEEDHLEVA